MHHKIIDDVVSWMFGIVTLGVAWMNINWAEVVPKIVASCCLAFIGGMLGYFGKLFGAWGLKKIKSLFSKNNNDETSN